MPDKPAITRTRSAEQRGITIKQAIAIAFEGMPERYFDVMSDREVRRLVTLYVKEFAENRGVILEDKDIVEELNAYLEKGEQ